MSIRSMLKVKDIQVCVSALMQNFHIILVFTSNYPARTCFQAGKLPLGANIEIEVIAITGDVKTVTLEA